jgi:MurNAc alpha-1-phosphate uridylyltransferase
MTMPRRAMVLAAGYGLRLRPITLSKPKPLVAVGGRTMLDRALDSLAAAGVAEAVVNAHYLREHVVAALAERSAAGRPPRTVVSEEEELLDTGGGIKKALPLLGGAPFLAVNADIVWQDGASPALERLGNGYDESRMDALLLLVARERAIGFEGPGDFFLDGVGRLARRGDAATAPYVYAGLQVLSADAFDDTPEGPFSLNRVYDRAVAAGRLFGLVHDGAWYHVGTPEALDEADRLLGAGVR